MSDEVEAKLIDRAEKNLQRHLEWVSRAETRAALILGIALGMLGFLATVLPPFPRWTCNLYWSAGIASLLLVGCVGYLFKSQFPSLPAPKESHVYFGEISKIGLENFVSKARNATDSEYLDDLLTQCHANARILNKKFYYLKWSMIFLALSAIPWLPAVYLAKTLQIVAKSGS